MLQLAPAFHVPLPAQDDKKKAKKLKMLGFPNCPMCGHDWLCSGALRLSCMPLSVNSIRKMEKKAKKEVPEWNLLSSCFGTSNSALCCDVFQAKKAKKAAKKLILHSRFSAFYILDMTH